MENSNKLDNAILLFDYFVDESKDLYNSFISAGIDIPCVVMEDDGFLPDTVESVIGSFLGDFSKGNCPGKPRYFNQIDIPAYWEIQATARSAKVVNLEREKARMFYREPKDERLVYAVDWLDEKGSVRYCDHYNKYGALWARTAFNASGKKVNKAYFDVNGREIIVENFVTNDIILNDGEIVRIFKGKVEFIKYYLKQKGYDTKRFFLNSLATPFFVSESLPPVEGGDVLFWQEGARPDVPGNMQMIFKGTASRCKYVYAQKRKSYENLIAAGANSEMLGLKGFIYPFVRENAHRAEALICTNSDNIEQLEKLTTELPQLHFHIVAITEMSSKLMAFDAKKNVSLYPGAAPDVIDKLFEKCDYYLDVNHENEIVNALRRAFCNNMLIWGFSNTIHNYNYILEDNIYQSSDCDKMIEDINKCLKDEACLVAILDAQKKHAMSEDQETFVNI